MQVGSNFGGAPVFAGMDPSSSLSPLAMENRLEISCRHGSAHPDNLLSSSLNVEEKEGYERIPLVVRWILRTNSRVKLSLELTGYPAPIAGRDMRTVSSCRQMRIVQRCRERDETARGQG